MGRTSTGSATAGRSSASGRWVSRASASKSSASRLGAATLGLASFANLHSRASAPKLRGRELRLRAFGGPASASTARSAIATGIRPSGTGAPRASGPRRTTPSISISSSSTVWASKVRAQATQWRRRTARGEAAGQPNASRSAADLVARGDHPDGFIGRGLGIPRFQGDFRHRSGSHGSSSASVGQTFNVVSHTRPHARDLTHEIACP